MLYSSTELIKFTKKTKNGKFSKPDTGFKKIFRMIRNEWCSFRIEIPVCGRLVYFLPKREEIEKGKRVLAIIQRLQSRISTNTSKRHLSMPQI